MAEDHPMGKIALMQGAPEEPPDSEWDLEVLRAINELLESARASASTTMVAVQANILGSSLRYQLGMSPAQAMGFKDSGLGRQELMICDIDNDPHAPVSLRGVGLGATFSTPVQVHGRQVGSLHIADTKPRQFSESQTDAVTEIAKIVGKRLERFLGTEREERRESLMRRAVSPAFAELRNALVPLNLGTSDLRMVAVDLLPLVTGAADSSAEEYETATRAHEDLVSLVDEIARASARVREVVMIVEAIWGEGGRTQTLADVLKIAAGLALHSTRLVGGVELPVIAPEYSVSVRRSVAVAALSLLLARAAEANASGVAEVTPLQLQLDCEAAHFYLRVSGKNLDAEDCQVIATEVQNLLLGDRDLVVVIEGAKVGLRLIRC